MSSINKTQNLSLNSWEILDPPQMEDFNRDNQILDCQQVKSVNPPTKDDDITKNHCLGAIWVDTTQKKAYILIDNTEQNAIWEPLANEERLNEIALKSLVNDSKLGLKIMALNSEKLLSLKDLLIDSFDDTQSLEQTFTQSQNLIKKTGYFQTKQTVNTMDAPTIYNSQLLTLPSQQGLETESGSDLSIVNGTLVGTGAISKTLPAITNTQAYYVEIDYDFTGNIDNVAEIRCDIFDGESRFAMSCVSKAIVKRKTGIIFLGKTTGIVYTSDYYGLAISQLSYSNLFSYITPPKLRIELSTTNSNVKPIIHSIKLGVIDMPKVICNNASFMLKPVAFETAPSYVYANVSSLIGTTDTYEISLFASTDNGQSYTPLEKGKLCEIDNLSLSKEVVIKGEVSGLALNLSDNSSIKLTGIVLGVS